MSFSKDHFEKAKKRRDDRLTGWINSVRKEQDFGIPRLRRKFKHVFKKIEWIPSDALLKEFDADEQSDTKSVILDIKLLGQDEPEVPPQTRASLFTSLPMEDQTIHDSNSSNSRLAYSRDDVKESDVKTPYSKAVLYIDDENDESLDTFGLETLPLTTPIVNNRKKIHRPSILQDMLCFQQRRKASRRGSSVNGIVTSRLRRPIQPKVKQKTETADPVSLPKIDVETAQENVPQPPEEVPAPTIVREACTNVTTKNLNELSIKTSPSETGGSKHKLKNIVAIKAPKMQGFTFSRARIKRPTKLSKMLSKEELQAVSKIALQTTEERRAEVLANFRRIVTLLIHVRVLLNVSRLRIEESEKLKPFKRYDRGFEISFDLSEFNTKSSYGALSLRARNALKKRACDRTQEDVRILTDLLSRLPVFMKYPASVRQDLSRSMWYDEFSNGRVIVKQGDPGSRMYFVISGEVDLKRTDVTDIGEEVCYHIQTLKAGSTFGELAMVRNMRREFTAVCKGTSEVISLGKDEFNQVLRTRWERDYTIRYNFMRACEHFRSWTDHQLQICADSSDLREYQDNTVIYQETAEEEDDSVFFIRKGQCQIVRRILLVRHQSPYLRPNILLPDAANKRKDFLLKSYAKSRRQQRDEVRYLTVTTLLPGNYFGTGESMRDTFIISRGKTECVVIKSAQFSIMGKSEQLRHMKSERENCIPSNKTLYEEFQRNRKWYEYRNKVLQEILRRKTKVHSESFANVPMSIRTKPTIDRDLLYYKKIV
ncbi:uncharacterized protein LOC127877364 [Dreissena polymorpha]|uniref:Cyclic nucleotide-binding domain-containing protein n=1 Tax=Dreissena polymorpha TaxID=45954 RepID=A0A9D4QPL2_DREPO|nr:uncharacterized protein LOC127877364 [Dreissena polymorpha]KAH3838861.1 hypothetical protein DPMN_112277 [Dreissena polymorpha]